MSVERMESGVPVQCRTCRFWKAFPPPGKDTYSNPANGGECVANPPTPGTQPPWFSGQVGTSGSPNRWPVTLATEWCGKWRDAGESLEDFLDAVTGKKWRTPSTARISDGVDLEKAKQAAEEAKSSPVAEPAAKPEVKPPASEEIKFLVVPEVPK